MNYQYIDTHAHVNLSAFKDDWREVIDRARAEGVAHINIGTQFDTSKRAVELAEQYAGGVHAIVGLHPIQTTATYHDEKELGEEPWGGSARLTENVSEQREGNSPVSGQRRYDEDIKGFKSRGEQFDISNYRELANSEKVVGIGECGFDYYRQSEESQKIQEEAFVAQIELANELEKPLMLHVRNGDGGRDAYDDVYEVIKTHAKVPGNVHFYAGTYEQAKKFFDLGFTISFTGVITFTNDYDELVKSTPLDMMHAETDCPYVAPKPFRGQRNEPLHVREVYKKIAQLKEEDEEKVRAQLMENSQQLYKF